METDKVKMDTSAETKENKQKKISSREMIKKLYLDENKNYEEISEELGLSINTIKLYISQGGYNKNPRRKRKCKISKEPMNEIVEEKKPIPENMENIDKPYIDIGDGYVVYEGRVMKKMTKKNSSKLC